MKRTNTLYCHGIKPGGGVRVCWEINKKYSNKNNNKERSSCFFMSQKPHKFPACGFKDHFLPEAVSHLLQIIWKLFYKWCRQFHHQYLLFCCELCVLRTSIISFFFALSYLKDFYSHFLETHHSSMSSWDKSIVLKNDKYLIKTKSRLSCAVLFSSVPCCFKLCPEQSGSQSENQSEREQRRSSATTISPPACFPTHEPLC